MHFASVNGQTEALQMLIDAGADIHARDKVRVKLFRNIYKLIDMLMSIYTN